MKRRLRIILAAIVLPLQVWAGFTFRSGADLETVVERRENPVVYTALEIFGKDYGRVFGGEVKTVRRTADARLLIGTLGSGSRAERMLTPAETAGLAGLHEGFLLTVKDGRILVVGSDGQGTAYGILELSRRIGVSPWEWWADSPVDRRESIELEEGFRLLEYPAVAYRGIFLNDEDWGLCPWSWQTHDPSEVKGRIGPKTHERIFELLLRLRANTFWPAMHDCSVPFFLTDGNREMADRYGIRIGTSHCEPMQRNTNGEWRVAGQGAYDYVNNPENVYRFWEERVREVARSDNYFTLGMRGEHDGKMQGAQTVDEQRAVLDRVIKDQRGLIGRYVDKEVTRVPQVFIPYKEVLEIYRSGLEVPDDVTLMWTDDNYGYNRYLPNTQEQQRGGGNGMYYHISYWGRPHDYLWLATTSPALIHTEMKRAYDYNVRQLWIVNVGDIKPGEYLAEYFLDLAWDKQTLENNNSNVHLEQWLAREFGAGLAGELLPLFNEYYALSYMCRPEFLGNTRTEERDVFYTTVKDLPWPDSEVVERLERCRKMESEVVRLSAGIAPERQAHWFQLVEYPIRSFCAMNRKMLGAQLARHGKAPWNDALQGQEEIQNLTGRYHSMLEGKWQYMMDSRPRNLPVFAPLDTTRNSVALSEFSGRQWRFKPSDGVYGSYSYTINELGYSREALVLAEGDTFTVALPRYSGSTEVTLAFVPNHPAGTDRLRVKVEIDGEPARLIDYETYDRSEEWKRNVLYNQALRTIVLPPSATARKMTVQALTPAVILDEIIVKSN